LLNSLFEGQSYKRKSTMDTINQQTFSPGRAAAASMAGPLLAALIGGLQRPNQQASYGQSQFAEQFGQPRTFSTGETSWFDQMFGTIPSQITQLPQFTMGQQSAMDQLLQDYLGRSRQLMDFSPIEEQARTGFQQKTLPSILERLQTFGGMGSSGAQHVVGQAGAGLEQNLAAMRQQFNEGMLNRLMQGAQMGLQPRYETVVDPARETAGSKMLTLGSQLIGLLAGGPIGEAAASGVRGLFK
jgi:hypothetical protein